MGAGDKIYAKVIGVWRKFIRIECLGTDDDNKLILADEILTPDCSRFWNKKNYKIGHSQQNYDREELKRYIKENGLSEDVINNIPSSILDGVEKRYKEIYKIITNAKL